ncbi:ASCH domain-containing protein [Nocardioides sp. AE5]|uniref:ASCH domain-containing protein n=1 Tax=Nocardioides sp. AE5 TaxID=2962573 RepID=UPI00288182B1|nr:ASCH domain-containing protein [Nocardioides sp. AE5]MDT0201125.1 ASCH domain-containing protein [Nocardioides sp. AE5]
MDEETDQPGNDAWIEAFWEDAHVHARVNPLGFYLGADPGKAMRPPAWAFGADPETADELVELVLDGTKTATASALRDYGEEELPRTGNLSIILDGSGRPRVLIATTGVRVVPFGTVDEEHARREGEGDLSLAHWREVHRAFFAETAAITGAEPEVTDETMVVLEEFEVVWQP